ncbi:hypothetical protein ES703_82830 [subsurface metagenome]
MNLKVITKLILLGLVYPFTTSTPYVEVMPTDTVSSELGKYIFQSLLPDFPHTAGGQLIPTILPANVTCLFQDFEVFRTEELTRSATVLMLDLSLSMPMRGNFEAAKRVVVALDGLIRSQYPKDSLYIVGFSSYARRVKKEDLSYMSWDEFDPYTNMQHGLYIARKLLAKERCTNKQIILISDGEPTAHIEGGNIFFQYPPSLRTVQLTLREVRNCTRKGIVINTFMLESGRLLGGSFVTQMARINKGRIFFTSADNLGQYLLVDYISNKKRGI